MGAHADILRSLLVELDRFDQQVEAITAGNNERITLTGEYIRDSAAQIAKRDYRPDWTVLRRNRSFLR